MPLAAARSRLPARVAPRTSSSSSLTTPTALSFSAWAGPIPSTSAIFTPSLLRGAGWARTVAAAGGPLHQRPDDTGCRARRGPGIRHRCDGRGAGPTPCGSHWHGAMKIGAVMPIGEGEVAGRTATYPELGRAARAAESRRPGFDLGLRPPALPFPGSSRPAASTRPGPSSPPWPPTRSASSWAPWSWRVPFRNPAVLAKMAATVDEISGGRLILGIGAGWHEPEFDAFGIAVRPSRLALRRRRSRSCCPCCAPARPTSRSLPRRRRRGSSFRAARGRSGPPILIAGKGPRMLGLVAEPRGRLERGLVRGRVGVASPRRRHARRARGGRPRSGDHDHHARDQRRLPAPARPRATSRPARAHRGTPQEIAPGLRAYAAEGIDHLIAACTPSTPEAMAALGEAARLARLSVDLAARRASSAARR